LFTTLRRSVAAMPIRVILADLPEPLRDGLERDLGQDIDLTVTSVGDHLELLLAVGEAQADVVILGMQEGDLPGIATHLVEEYPHLRILTVHADARRVRVCELLRRLVQIDNVPLGELPEVVSAVIRSRD
jgi:DNA-binding NarL/FixJ family response regulator